MAKTKKKPTKKKAVKKALKSPAKKKAATKKKDPLMCFLTSACVDYYGLKDNGYELNTLRNYRDTYLTSSENGKNLIQKYYKISPQIVKRVNKDPFKNEQYSYIYQQISSACIEIENQQFEKAKNIYQNMVNRLIKNYSL